MSGIFKGLLEKIWMEAEILMPWPQHCGLCLIAKILASKPEFCLGLSLQ